MNEILQSREQFKAEKELLEKNTKLMEEINRYRKREYQLKAQLHGDHHKLSSKDIKGLDNHDVTSLLVNLDIRRNHLIKDIGDRTDGTRISNTDINQRK